MDQKNSTQELLSHLMEPAYKWCNKDLNHPIGILVDWLKRNPCALDSYGNEIRESIIDFLYFDDVYREYSWEGEKDEIDEENYENARKVFDSGLKRLEGLIGSIETDNNFLDKFHKACSSLYDKINFC